MKGIEVVLCGALVLIAQMANAQPATGTIRGMVVDQSGKSAGRVIVIYQQLSPNTPRVFYGPRPKVALTGSVLSDTDGRYQFINMPPGTYRLCVQTLGNLYLDPCEWSAQPPTVVLEAGSATGYTVRLDRGVPIMFVVDDEDGVFDVDEKKQRKNKGTVSIGVRTLNGSSRSAFLLDDSTPRRTTRFLRVPSEQAVSFEVSATDVDVSDSAGKPVGKELKLTLARSVTPHIYKLRVKTSAKK